MNTMMRIKISNQPLILCVFLLFICLNSCKDTSTPRPYGYFRVDLPPHQYVASNFENFPYSFDISKIAITESPAQQNEKYWIDIKYPSLNASIYCSYKPVNSNLFELTEDTRKIVYKHTVKAENIAEIPYENAEQKVYGILYELTGNTASPVQFVLTDSNKNFFRGALYFENVPNKDSIAPIVQYVQKDIVRLIESFEWKN